jgi:hypothetical protein
MLGDNAQIHVLYNTGDRALNGSSWGITNDVYRLGQRGIGKIFDGGAWIDFVQKDYALPHLYNNEKYVNIDCQHKSISDIILHSYQFEDWAIEYYADPENKREYDPPSTMDFRHDFKMK